MASERKRLKAPQRRAIIVSAALGEFARSGYEGTSMDAIAAASGISKPVLYDHFPSKQKLFVAALETVRDALLVKGREAARLPADDELRFRSAIESFFSFVGANPDAIRVLLLVPHGSPQSLAASRTVQKGASAAIAELLRPVLRGQRSADIEAVAEFLKRSMHVLAEWWLDHPKISVSHMTELCMTLCWSGVGGLTAKGAKTTTERQLRK
ncbi:MAG: TetR/AcrR family transcriptional regulator [Steroidobacteraceae bacterium]